MKQLVSIVVLMMMVGSVVAENDPVLLRGEILVLKNRIETLEIVVEDKDVLIMNLERQIEGYQKQVESYQKQIEEYQKQSGGKVVIVQEPVLTEEQKAAVEKEAKLRQQVEESSVEWLDRGIEKARAKELERGNTHCSRSLRFFSKKGLEGNCARGDSSACSELERLKDCW